MGEPVPQWAGGGEGRCRGGGMGGRREGWQWEGGVRGVREPLLLSEPAGETVPKIKDKKCKIKFCTKCAPGDWCTNELAHSGIN